MSCGEYKASNSASKFAEEGSMYVEVVGLSLAVATFDLSFEKGRPVSRSVSGGRSRIRLVNLATSQSGNCKCQESES